MQSSSKTFPVWAIASVAAIGTVLALSSQVGNSPASGPATSAAAAVGHAAAAAAAPVAQAARSVGAKTVTAAAAVAAVTPSATPAIRLATPVAKAAISFASEEAVRAQLKFESVKYAGKKIRTLDEESRLLLVQAAAQRAELHKVGLSFEDVYGVIEAETSWIPRTGMGKNGVSSYGLAQFEPRTARGLGLRNPNDPVQAVYAAAVNMKHGAEWAEKKVAHLELTPEQRAEKIREGVSIYYNLSIKGRNKWNGLNTADLPVETQRHIRNVRAGAEEASTLAETLDV